MKWMKRNLFSVMNILTAVFVGIILILIINQQAQNAAQLKSNSTILDNQKQLLENLRKTAMAISKDNHSDHDTQLRYVQCIVNLFGSKPGQIITQAEFDACLAGTRIEPATTSTIAPNPNPAPAPSPSPAPTPTNPPPKQSLMSRIINGIKGVFKLTRGKK